MNRQEFIDALRQRLSEEGFPADYVDTQCTALTEKLNSLPEDTVAQYTTQRNLDIIVRKLSSQDNKEIVSTEDEIEDTPQSMSDAAGRRTASSSVEFVDEDSLSVRRQRTARNSVAATEYTPCDKPRLLLFLLALLSAPTIILLLLTAFGLFGGVFMLLAASIFFIVVAIIAIVGIGSVVSVGALLYGATQVLSSPRYVGFHEIGFGLLVAGITLASSILLYNMAIRWIPFISQQMGKLMKLFFSKLVTLAKNAVKGCEQL